MRRRMMGGGKIDYDKYPNGVYILHVNGKLYTRAEWNAAWNDSAVGVALKTDNCRFVIAPEGLDEDNLPWSKYGAYEEVPGVTTTTEEIIAIDDYKGEANTAAIVSHYGAGTDYAVGWCANYTFKNGAKGYLGACGEWLESFNNKAEIDACMNLITGGIAIKAPYYYSSTQYDFYFAWGLTWSRKDVYANSKSIGFYVRAFAPLE